MATIAQNSLFSWKEIDAASDLDRLQLVLSVLPDEELMRTLEAKRGRGRNDYPLRATWNAFIAGIVYNHRDSASLLRELRRNGELRQVCGFDPLRGSLAVPSEDAFGRFLASIVSERRRVEQMFHTLVESLGHELPDLGRRLAVDSKGIPSFGKPVRDEAKQKQDDGRRDTDADFGTKTYRGKRKDGSTWEKTKRWFGYKLHLLVDSTYEMPLAFEVTRASASDAEHLTPLVENLEKHHRHIVENAEELSADKAYDAAGIKARLYDEWGIKPVIDHRMLWKDDKGRPRPLFDRADVFSYDERGRVYCHCPSERRFADEQREMAFVGFEKDRKALKYRCPAAHNEFDCLGRAECEANAQVGTFGRVVRVPLSYDRRIFTPIARHTDKWRKAYDRRTAVERVNSLVQKSSALDFCSRVDEA